MTVRIVKSDEHDEEIAALDLMCFTVDEAFPVELPASADCWVALDGDDVVGYLVAHSLNENGRGGVHYLDRYGVASSHGAQGIGKRLLRAWLRYARNTERWSNLLPPSGGPYAWTYTVAHNAKSINALIATGFKAWGCDVLPSGQTRDKHYCVWRKNFS